MVNSNVRKFACGKCRKVLFTENELQEHSSEVKAFKPRDNKVRNASAVAALRNISNFGVSNSNL